MHQNDDHTGREDEDGARTLDAGKLLGNLLYGIGSTIGSYKLLRILGEGGFGVVYLAEQQRPIKRQVALKVIKPGMDSAQVIRRFEAERQALALLDHPNVAHVYDAGTTEAGRPYFAMEYVKGVPITEHCDRQKLTIEERLKLFVQVCEAIQHAHQKGIIHRDIKPSNIQVCIQDEQAIPKVIDFGVAKALSQPLTERTLVTEQGQLIGTPEYISPEQAEMTNQDIDTRSDIYSLGVLLYELLTGTLPFESETLRRGSLDQMRQMIRETEPKTPSTRVSTLDAEILTRVAKCCQSDVATLQRRLHGDLDWITLKAMEKDRMRRYQTAHALAEDIQRHLSNEPVLAGRPGTLYRFQKLVRRNQGVFAAAVAVAVVLLLGVVVSSWQALRARRAEQTATAKSVVAETQRQRAEAKELAMRQLAYASDMSLAQQALATNDLGRALRLLNDHRPALGKVDLRDWEWRYLWQECRSDAVSELCRYPNSAYSVAYSPDGKALGVAGQIQEFVEIWDVPSRRRIKTIQPKEGHLVAFSPRGDLLATDAGNRIRLWRADTWDSVTERTLDGEVAFLKFSPDGSRLAAMVIPDEIIVWELDQWRVVCQIHDVGWFRYWNGVLDFSPDGTAIVIGVADGHLQVVDLARGKTRFNIPEAHPESIVSVAWSPDGSIIASGSGWLGGPIKSWEAASGRELEPLEGHTSWISELVFSTDGQCLYSASGDQTVRIWDVGQHQCLATLRGSRHEVLGLALSPDGTTLASGCKDGVVSFWSALPRTDEKQPRLIRLGQYSWPAFAPDGRILAVPRRGTVSLFEMSTLGEIEQLHELGTDVSILAYSPDGTLLVSGNMDGTIRVWSCAGRRLLQERHEHQKMVHSFHFRPDGKQLLSLDDGGNAIWWDTLTWQASRVFTMEISDRDRFSQPVAVSPDGSLLAAITKEETMHWLNAKTGELIKTTSRPPGPSSLRAKVAFSGDGSKVASVSTYGTVALWDPSSFTLIEAFKGHMLGAHGVAFSTDGRRLATGGGSSPDAVKLWDPVTRRELLTLSGQGSIFASVVFSPDGRWLAACSMEGRLNLWRAPSWAEIEAAEKQGGSYEPER
ncbi:MAG: protein kinase [Sedimentisphaerales bacterium]|nr:protein kinase [Sedimentisphaerales bacterium]